MNKNLIYALLIIAGFFGIMYLIDHLNEEYVWQKSFDEIEDQPYDVSMLYKLLQDKEFEVKNKPIYSYLHLEENNEAVYFLLSTNDYLNNKQERDSLLSFVARGNTAFIAVNELSLHSSYNSIEEMVSPVTEPQDEYYNEEEEEEEETIADDSTYAAEEVEEYYYDEVEEEELPTDANDTSAMISNNELEESIEPSPAENSSQINNTSFQPKYNFHLAEDLKLNFGKFKSDTVIGKVNGSTFSFSKKEVVLKQAEKTLETVEDDYFFIEENAQTKTIGSINDKVNLAEVPHGKGKFYFYSTPILLTNYSMVQEQGFTYAQQVLKVIPKGKKIIWDEYNRSFNYDVSELDNKKKNSAIKTPLSFIFGNRSLKAAYYSILGTAVLFVIFYARRKQRAIPIILGKKNNSVEFAKTIGSLYLQSNHHKYIISYQMKHLLLFIKNKYKLQLKGDLDDFVTRLGSRSEIKQEQLLTLFKDYQSYQEKRNLNDKEFLSFNQAITYFYSNCK